VAKIKRSQIAGHWPEIRSSKSEILNNIEFLKKLNFSKQICGLCEPGDFEKTNPMCNFIAENK